MKTIQEIKLEVPALIGDRVRARVAIINEDRPGKVFAAKEGAFGVVVHPAFGPVGSFMVKFDNGRTAKVFPEEVEVIGESSASITYVRRPLPKLKAARRA